MIKKYITDINNNIYVKESSINNTNTETNNVIEITNTKINKFYGFGSGITESSSFNYDKLSKENKKRFINDYFTKDGLNFNYGRISIGSNDFALNGFSYAKKRDLSDFSINRDKEYVIPFIKDILEYKDISLIASPWSPPRMYKRLPILKWGIKLKKKYYENYSNYLIKYLNEYDKLGIKIDYLTMQNEPMARQRWESCKYSLLEQKTFIYKYLLPKLHDTKVLLWDHNKDDLFEIVNELYENNNKIGGVGFHYYTGNNFSEIKKIREKYHDLLLINTEMCCSYSKYDEKSWIGSAEYYLKDIIGDMNSGVNAYLDWNILLDENGGPTYKNNPVKSPSIRVDDNYIKSPIYYYLYHISHFTNNSVIVVNKNNTKMHVVSFKNDNELIVVVMNNSSNNINYKIVYGKKTFNDSVNSHSIITYIL